MSRLRGDMFSIRSVITSAMSLKSAYGKGKRKAILAGIVASTYAIAMISRFAPRVAASMSRGAGRLFGGRETRVGRGVDVPKQEEGSVQDGVRRAQDKGESVQQSKPVRKKTVNKLDRLVEEGGNIFAEHKEKRFLVEGEALRLLSQIVEGCKEYNKKTKGSLNVTYDLSDTVQGELLVKVEGNILKVNEQGIYSAVGNIFYEYGKMSKDDGLNRLVSEYTVRYINLIVMMLLAYEKDLFEIEEYSDVFKIEVDESEQYVV